MKLFLVLFGPVVISGIICAYLDVVRKYKNAPVYFFTGVLSATVGFVAAITFGVY